jgi:hypothetical protein
VWAIPVHPLDGELDGENGDGETLRSDQGVGQEGAIPGFRVCAEAREMAAAWGSMDHGPLREEWTSMGPTPPKRMRWRGNAGGMGKIK